MVSFGLWRAKIRGATADERELQVLLKQLKHGVESMLPQLEQCSRWESLHRFYCTVDARILHDANYTLKNTEIFKTKVMQDMSHQE